MGLPTCRPTLSSAGLQLSTATILRSSRPGFPSRSCPAASIHARAGQLIGWCVHRDRSSTCLLGAASCLSTVCCMCGHKQRWRQWVAAVAGRQIMVDGRQRAVMVAAAVGREAHCLCKCTSLSAEQHMHSPSLWVQVPCLGRGAAARQMTQDLDLRLGTCDLGLKFGQHPCLLNSQ